MIMGLDFETATRHVMVTLSLLLLGLEQDNEFTNTLHVNTKAY